MFDGKNEEKYMAHDGQSVVLKDRNSLNLTGISSVDSFDDRSISVTTKLGTLLIVEGTGLVIKDVNLENGSLEAEGLVSGLFYDDRQKPKKGLFSGIFGAK